MIEHQDEIDLLKLFYALLKKWVVILFTTILGAAIALAYTIYCVTPMYKSTIAIYVNNSSISLGSTKVSVTTGDLSASQGLVDTYIVILKTRNTLNEVIKDSGVQRSVGELSSMISAAAINGTQIFNVTVQSPNPSEAQSIAKSIGNVLPNKINSIIDYCSARIVDDPIVPTNPSSPSVQRNTMMGAMAGFAIACAIIVIRELLDDEIKTEEDLVNAFGFPVLASIPNLVVKSGAADSYVYGYGEEPDKDILEILGIEDKEGGSK